MRGLMKINAVIRRIPPSRLGLVLGLALTLLAGTVVWSTARARVSAAADPPERSTIASTEPQLAPTGELPLTLGDHCSRRTSWNGPPFPKLPFVEPEPQDHADACVPRGFEHEVWLLDQSNTNGLTYGGTLYIYDPEQLRHSAATASPERIDPGGATSALCFAETGAFPVRPHMLVFNTRGNTHAIVSFVASGHVVFFDAATRTPLKCFRTEPGAGGAR